MKVKRHYERSQADAYREMAGDADQARITIPELYAVNRQWNHSPRVIHHIHGRGAPRRYHWFCNLIQIGHHFHEWGHDKFPPILELVCLHSKMKMELLRIGAGIPLDPDESRWAWNPSVMAQNIGRASLSGRVSELLQKPSVKRTPYAKFGEKLLHFLG